jgi:hypothetical protein
MKHILGFACWLLSMSLAHAQPYTSGQRVDLRITGTFLATDAPRREDFVTVDVSVQDRPMVLRLGKVEDLTTREKAQAVKDEVLLHNVRFTGAEAMMARLAKPETVGKTVTIEGWLNTKDRLFQVTDVHELTEATPASK